MAEKDIAEKTLEAYDDVFADIINVLLFQGRQFVKEDELEEESLASSYKADGRLHAQERDVASCPLLPSKHSSPEQEGCPSPSPATVGCTSPG